MRHGQVVSCPMCGGLTRVICTRRYPSGTKRWRQCLQCDNRFTTYQGDEHTTGGTIRKEILPNRL